MNETLDYNQFLLYNPSKYSVKSKIIIKFGKSKFSRKGKDNFIEALPIDGITNKDHEQILKGFRTKLIGTNYQIGYFGYDDNRSIAIIELVEDGTVIVNLFNNSCLTLFP